VVIICLSDRAWLNLLVLFCIQRSREVWGYRRKQEYISMLHLHREVEILILPNLLPSCKLLCSLLHHVMKSTNHCHYTLMPRLHMLLAANPGERTVFCLKPLYGFKTSSVWAGLRVGFEAFQSTQASYSNWGSMVKPSPFSCPIA
jgi:hypothetical protein